VLDGRTRQQRLQERGSLVVPYGKLDRLPVDAHYSERERQEANAGTSSAIRVQRRR
jgi:hypothetical protein